MKISKNIHKAMVVTAKAHKGQTRKGSDIPYIIHPMSVATTVDRYRADETTIIAGLLHDILEDVEPEIYSEQDMDRDFGTEVVSIVKNVTKDSSIKDWRSRNLNYLKKLADANDQRSLMVATADKIHNLSTMLYDYEEIGDGFWDRFNAGLEDQKWWFKEIMKTLEIKLNHPIVAELDSLVKRLVSLK